MNFTRDPKHNQQVIMDSAIDALDVVLKHAEREKWPKQYLWRLRGAIILLRHPPGRDDGKFKG